MPKSVRHWSVRPTYGHDTALRPPSVTVRGFAQRGAASRRPEKYWLDESMPRVTPLPARSGSRPQACRSTGGQPFFSR